MKLPWESVLSVGAELIDSLFTSDDERAEARLKLTKLAQEGRLKQMEAAMTVVVAEAKSDHFIVAAWRPITMLTFVFIVANNYIIYPYLNLLFDTGVELDLPPDLWNLIKIGLGGYVVGRSGEKMVKAYKK